MSKIVMRLYLPEPQVRKRTARAVQKHKDKKKYTRQCKHKAAGFGGLCFSAPPFFDNRIGVSSASPLVYNKEFLIAL